MIDTRMKSAERVRASKGRAILRQRTSRVREARTRCLHHRALQKAASARQIVRLIETAARSFKAKLDGFQSPSATRTSRARPVRGASVFVRCRRLQALVNLAV